MEKKNSLWNALLGGLLYVVMVNTAIAAPNERSNQTGNGAIREYFDAVQNKIRANWKPPKGPESACPIVRFKILPDGQVVNLQIYHSAGDPRLDTSVLEAVKTAAPFPEITILPYKNTGLLGSMNFNYNQKPAKDKTNQLISQANRSLKAGNWQLAVILLTKALENDPDNARVKSELSGIYSNQATVSAAAHPRSKEALILARKAYSLDPNNNEAKKILQGQ